jgi:hypothetical protein
MIGRATFATALFLTAPLLAQDFRAGISGIVKDSQGALIPNAAIEAVDLDTNVSSRTVTNASGYYSLPVLPIGFYRVKASASGFKNQERNRLRSEHHRPDVCHHLLAAALPE